MQYILFDMDGTLCDSARGIINAARYALERCEIAVGDVDLRQILGPPLRDSFGRMFGLDGERLEKVVAAYREHYFSIGMYENDLYPGVADLVCDLHDDGRVLALATGKVGSLATDILRHFELASYFAFVAGCELDGRRSHKCEVIEYALENLGATGKKADTVMVGDRHLDIEGAARACVTSVGVLYGYGTRAEIEACRPDYIAESVEALRNIVLGGNFCAQEKTLPGYNRYQSFAPCGQTGLDGGNFGILGDIKNR